MSKKLLLVSPVFHGYWQGIAQAFKQRGYTVLPYCYDRLENAAHRVEHKLKIELADRRDPHGLPGSRLHAQQVTARCAQLVRSSRPDVVVTIKGDILQADYWQSIEEVGAKRITWFYDELRRMNVDEAGLQMRGPIATYSAIDAAAMAERGLDAFYLPLAFESSLPFRPVASDAVVFVGARYGQREPMLRALYQAGVDVKAYGRAWSKHWWDRARTWSWHRPAIPSGRDLDRSHAYGVMAGARALVWSQADGEFWASSRTDVTWQVVGSQLLFNAALQPRIKVSATARPLFLGQLHGAEIGRSYMAQVSERFCRDTGAIYRPHPSEKDKASRLIHAYWRRRGIEFDPGTSPLFETNRPVVSVFSTGTLEAAARGIPAWVYAPNAPSWVHSFHTRYGLSRWSDIPTVAPQAPALEPATAIAQILAA